MGNTAESSTSISRAASTLLHKGEAEESRLVDCKGQEVGGGDKGGSEHKGEGEVKGGPAGGLRRA